MSVYVHGTLKVHNVDQFVYTYSVVMKFYETTIGKQLIQEVKHCMQGQDDDASSFEDDHAPRSTPEKKRISSGQLLLGELWRGTLAQSNNENHLNSLILVKCYEKSTAPASSTWRWPKKTDEQDYHIMDIKHKINTPEDVPRSIRNLVVWIPELERI